VHGKAPGCKYGYTGNRQYFAKVGGANRQVDVRFRTLPPTRRERRDARERGAERAVGGGIWPGEGGGASLLVERGGREPARVERGGLSMVRPVEGSPPARIPAWTKPHGSHELSLGGAPARPKGPGMQGGKS